MWLPKKMGTNANQFLYKIVRKDPQSTVLAYFGVLWNQQLTYYQRPWSVQIHSPEHSFQVRPGDMGYRTCRSDALLGRIDFRAVRALASSDRNIPIIIHKDDQPDVVVHFFDADSLTGKNLGAQCGRAPQQVCLQLCKGDTHPVRSRIYLRFLDFFGFNGSSEYAFQMQTIWRIRPGSSSEHVKDQSTTGENLHIRGGCNPPLLR